MSIGVPSDTRAKTAKQLRRMRARRLALRMGLGVGLPTLIAALYYGAWITPRYESVSSFTIETADSAIPSSALQMLMSSTGTSSRDVMLVQEYVLSRDMLTHLIAEHGWTEHYASEGSDWFSRLDPSASLEEKYDYYLDHVEVVLDSQSGVLTLHVQAFDAETANRLGQAILAASEQMVNQLSEASRQDRIELSQAELTRAEERLGRARAALRELQSEHGDLNPLASAEAIMGVRTRLEGELAIARAELSTVAATLPRGAPEISAARHRIRALEGQVAEQNDRLAGAGAEEGTNLSGELAQFEPVVIEKEFAQRAYESALTSLEFARVEASRQHRYLVRISGPSQPDDPTHPKFWYSLLTVLALAFAILGVGTLLLASIREHANV